MGTGMASAATPAFRPTFEPGHRESTAMKVLRSRAWERFSETGFPTPREEAWRFTNLRKLVDTPYEPAPRTETDVSASRFAGFDTLVFVNGRFDERQSTIGDLPSGARYLPLGAAREHFADLVDKHLGRYAAIDGQTFAALNTAQDHEGVFMHLAPGTVLDRPLQVVYATSSETTASVTYPRTLVVGEEGAEATIIESFTGDGASLSCPVTEIVLGPGAVIRHVRLQDESPENRHMATVAAHLERDARYSASMLSLGGLQVRLDISAILAGQGADASLFGLSHTADTQHVDHQVRIEHLVPDCTSRQVFKSILDENSKAIFTGRIVVAEDAQRTDAKQSNCNLLLSEQALAQSNPQLEIYADDVRCTHGSTVGRLDDDALFYLRSRGLDKQVAEQILTWAFASEVIDTIPVDEVRVRLANQLRTRLLTVGSGMGALR